jgi:hypothetical protein
MKPVTQAFEPEIAAFRSKYFPGPALQSKLFVLDPASNRDGRACSVECCTSVVVEHPLRMNNVDAKQSFLKGHLTIKLSDAGMRRDLTAGCERPLSGADFGTLTARSWPGVARGGPIPGIDPFLPVVNECSRARYRKSPTEALGAICVDL